MKDLISREALLKKYCKEPAKGDCKNCDWYGDSWCRCEIFGVQIAEEPAADAVEVVRCRDCKHLMFSDCYGECGEGHMGIVSPDDFCSYGRRKEGADNG